MADPHVYMVIGKVLRIGKDSVVGLGSQFLMLFRIDMLNIKHDKIGQRYKLIHLFDKSGVIRLKCNT